MRKFLVLACFVATPALAQDGVRASDDIIGAAELHALLRGQVVEFYDGSKSRYGGDGSYGYTYTDGGPVWRGQYRVPEASRVCVDFENGSARCDLFVRDGERVVLITRDGMRFPVRSIAAE